MNDKKDKAVTVHGQSYEVPAGGSLGLLALGYRGLEAWREAYAKYKKEEAAKDGKEKK
jgi:hypothetical protein